MKNKRENPLTAGIHVIALAVVLLAIWEAICRIGHVSPLVVPAPSGVVVRLYGLLIDGTMWPHLMVTLTEVLIGFGVGIASGLVVGTLVSLVPAIEKLIYPYLVALQTVPKVAVAPLLVIWFGYGLASKVVITALICFFPILVSVISGFNSTDRDQLDMMKAYGATTLQTLFRLRIPSALVLIFAGLEIASVLAVIGTIVGEFVGAQAGLGYLIMSYNFSLDITGVFAVLIILSAIGMIMHSITRFAGRRYIFWIRREQPAVMPH
jgi:NitT/TauT family transport system permease protein